MIYGEISGGIEEIQRTGLYRGAFEVFSNEMSVELIHSLLGLNSKNMTFVENSKKN